MVWTFLSVHKVGTMNSVEHSVFATLLEEHLFPNIYRGNKISLGYS